MRRKGVLTLGLFLFAVLMLISGCNPPAPEKAAREEPSLEATLAPLATAAIDSTETATPEEVLPEPTHTEEAEAQQEFSLDNSEEWDLVYISDNSGVGVPYYLPAFMEEDTGKTVSLHNFVTTELSAQAVLDALRGETTNNPSS